MTKVISFKCIGNSGFLSLIDSLLAILLVLIALMAFNLLLAEGSDSLSEDVNMFKTSQDIMEIMSSSIDGKDYSMIAEISYTLNKYNNSKSAQREVSDKLVGFFNKYLKGVHYSFVENNQLKGKELAADGDRFSSNNLTVATRIYENYSYQLYVW